MNTLPYTILRWEGPTSGSSGVQFDVGIAAKAKYRPDSPLEVANELLALRLGMPLGLPIPNGIPVRDEDEGPADGRMLWASLTAEKEQLPKASDEDIREIIADVELACGIVVYDSWILNEDRWRKNIARFEGKTYVFDHGDAFGAGQKGALEKNGDAIGIGVHCLAGITTLEPFDYWWKRILEVPSWYVLESVRMATGAGMTEEYADYLGPYLLDRRNKLRGIFRAKRGAVFPKLNEGLFDPLAEHVVEYEI